MPICRQFAPDLVLVSCGFDAAAGDPLGAMSLSPLGFAAMAARLGQLAGGRVVYALEGGYKPSVAARCMLAVLRLLPPCDSTQAAAVCDPVMQAVIGKGGVCVAGCDPEACTAGAHSPY